MKTSDCHGDSNSKVIGIIGGSGPEAGADLFGKVLALHRKKLGKAYKSDRDAPDIVLMSVSNLGGPRTAIDIEPGNLKGTYEQCLAALDDTIRKIVPLVDYFCVACNTLHMFESQIREALLDLGRNPSMFVSMISSTIDTCQGQLDGNESVKFSIFGGPVTMDLDGNSSYRRLVEEVGIEHFYRPPPSCTSILQRIIWKIKQDGKVTTRDKVFAEYEGLLRDMASHSVKICVLACTELSLIDIVDITDLSIKFIDPTEVVANALLNLTQSYPEENNRYLAL
uniref:Aspartate racemase n=1 Tax=Pseudo-nitzschia australis TaxID=44445 RepID=A0A7S4EGR7_9STRA|mmetsp:Transcript_62/g.157  ORF Transcript_62/g.157 Transcript_62/m.157 type:complete len:281 (+) Transcript_62:56-898(+)